MPGKDDLEFYPPRANGLARAAMKVILPFLHSRWTKLAGVELPPEDRQRLLSACGGPCLICPNHPSLHEPVVLYDCLTRLRIRACYVVARSTMALLGWRRWIVQGIGGYSIRRGAADRASFAMTRRLLREGRSVVIFPEGETYGLNDTLLPFHEGVVQLGFWGLQDRLKEGIEGPVRALPVAIKYLYRNPMGEVIDARLDHLEAHLGLRREGGMSRYERLRRVGFACARVLEREFEIKLSEDASLDEHIDGLYEHLMGRISTSLGVTLREDATRQDKLRQLYNVVEEALSAEEEDLPPYARALQEQHGPAWRAFERDLARLHTFQAVKDGYVAAHPSAERYLDVIGRLETEMLGESAIRGRRKAVVRVGEPIDLASRYPDYERDRRGCVGAVTEELRSRMMRMIDALSTLAPAADPAG